MGKVSRLVVGSHAASTHAVYLTSLPNWTFASPYGRAVSCSTYGDSLFSSKVVLGKKVQGSAGRKFFGSAPHTPVFKGQFQKRQVVNKKFIAKKSIRS